MKSKLLLAASLVIASSLSVLGADAAANYAKHCAACHAKDGTGNTVQGKKTGAKDYTKDQSFSDADATKAIKSGAGKMKGFGEKLSDDEIKALVAYVRTFKK